MLSRQFIAFVVTGGIAALLNFGSRILLGYFVPYVPSIIIAYIVGMVTAFVLNRWLVFKEADGSIHHQVAWFIAINVLAVLQTLLVSVALADWLLPLLHIEWHRETLAHAVGVATPVVTSYLGHKHFTFRTKPNIHEV